MHKIFALIAWLMLSGIAHAQTNLPYVYSNPSSGSPPTKATMTGSYIQVLAANQFRKTCLIQNVGTHTMYVYWGSAPADNTTSIQVAPGNWFSCNNALNVITDAIQVQGTTGDVAIVGAQ